LKSVRKVENIILKVEECLLNALMMPKLVLFGEKFAFARLVDTLDGKDFEPGTIHEAFG
jgi:hypothetical protein